MAAEQLGSLSLGGSVERKDNDTEPKVKNGTTPTKNMCSACGEKSDTLMKCRACKCVWYCDKECQNKHWREHKKECKLIKKELDKRGGKLNVGTEVDVGPLGELPPREECPICMRVPPLHVNLTGYAGCCGKTICGGCNFQHQMKSQDLAAERGQTPPPRPTCAFCRTTLPDSDKEIFARLRKRVELKDAKAILNMAQYHGYGQYGLPVDQAKCIDLLRQSADLGCSDAHFKLGNFYHFGEMGALEKNEEEALKCWEKAAEVGHLPSLFNLGCAASENGDVVAAMRHFRLAASGGDKGSMDGLIECFERGLIRHADLSKTVQAMYLSRDEMKSEGRDQYIAYLKRTGKYDANLGM